jgi:hypothetical protein
LCRSTAKRTTICRIGHFCFDQFADAAAHLGYFFVDGQLSQAVVFELVNLQIDGAGDKLLSHRTRTLLVDLLASQCELVDGSYGLGNARQSQHQNRETKNPESG